MTGDDTERQVQDLRDLFVSVNERALRDGARPEDLYQIFLRSRPSAPPLRSKQASRRGYGCSRGQARQGRRWAAGVALGAVIVGVAGALLGALLGDDALDAALGVRCVVPNNFLVWEATRPVADCGICRGVDAVLELHNVSREQFAPFAYSSRPIVVRGAAAAWPAVRTFSYDYFKQLYESTEGAYESVEDECQLLTFKTEFLSLKDVFSMSRSRVLNLGGEQPWYIGW